MADRHVEELAELYALGALSHREGDDVQRYIADCASCERRVGEAEEAVLAIERQYREQTPPDALGARLKFPRRPAATPRRYAAAIGVMFPQLQRGGEAQRAQLAMIRSHFSHAQFVAASAGAPDAKVIYARDRQWLYVIATGRETYEVDALEHGSRTVLGHLHPNGSASILFIDRPARATSLQLRSGASVIERAALR